MASNRKVGRKGGNSFEFIGELDIKSPTDLPPLLSDIEARAKTDTCKLNKNNKDDTNVEVSTIPKVKQLAAMFEGLMINEPGQTSSNMEAKPLGKRRLLLTGRNLIAENVGSSDDSGPNKNSTKETSANPAIDGTPTEIKEQGGSKDDTYFRPLDTVEMGCDFIEEISITGQGKLYNDPCLTSDLEDEMGCDIVEECSETTKQDVIRSEGTVIDGMNYSDIGKLMEKLNMNATSLEEDKQKLKQRLFRGQRIDTYSHRTNQDVIRPEAHFVDAINYLQVGQILQELNMDVTNSPEGDKLRLKQRLFRGLQTRSSSQQIKDVVNKTVQRYKRLKKKLIDCYYDIRTTVEKESFKENMSDITEMRFPHYEDKLQSTMTMLQNMTDEFEIVVYGETSSGKSTFINVLLGERILPSHHLHTTASLCRLRNSVNRRIERIVNNKIVSRITLKEDTRELRSKLESLTKELLSKDGDSEPLQAIDIYWPVSSLHENVVLVDTPGIGERDALTKQVVDYAPKSAGYIIIVDSSRAGGVQESGIKKLIEAITVSESKDDYINGLRNAIFVCNKWDRVPEQEREDVLRDTKRKISKYCGQLKDWQIVLFNANLELKLQEWKANPTDDFKSLLKSLETLMIETIETRLRDKYRWLHSFILEITGFVVMRMQTAKLSKEKVQIEMTIARGELDRAEKELEQLNEVEAMICEEENVLSQSLEKYLKCADVQEKLFDWTIIAPQLSNVDEEGPKLIAARLEEVMLEWASAENGPLKLASVRIADRCKEIQAQFDLKIRKLNDLELGFSLRESSDHCEYLGSDENDSLSGKDIAIVLATSPIWITVGLAVLVVGLIPGLVWAINRAVHSKTRRIQQMTNMTAEAIDILVSENHLQKFINDSCTSFHRIWVKQFRTNTICTISSTLAWMQRIEDQFYVNKDKLQLFQPLHSNLTECLKCLQELEKNI